jgi:3-dehydroquinate synthase
MIIPVKTQNSSYNIYLERGALSKASEYFDLNRKVLVITDSGVPQKYVQTIANCCKEPILITIEMGEKSKNIDTFTYLLECLVKNGFTRTDCVVAVGGGVVGDLSGFVASVFMRGIDFYNIPTTVLSQVDSSIGGKTAIDFMGYKNIVGAFYPPKAVLIDPDTLNTLCKRQISNGLAEALKMATTNDEILFEIFEKDNILENIDTIIERSLYIKKYVVEEDEKEKGLRKVLNFGHTLAHAIESANKLDNYYHGECVAMGMIPMCAPAVRDRLLPIFKKLDIPSEINYPVNDLLEACRHDKKVAGDKITVVYVEKIGTFKLETLNFAEFENLVKEGLIK